MLHLNMYSNISCFEFESYIYMQMNRIVYDGYCQSHPPNNIHTRKRKIKTNTFKRVKRKISTSHKATCRERVITNHRDNYITDIPLLLIYFAKWSNHPNKQIFYVFYPYSYPSHHNIPNIKTLWATGLWHNYVRNVTCIPWMSM